jgi:hypothetical protein
MSRFKILLVYSMMFHIIIMWNYATMTPYIFHLLKLFLVDYKEIVETEISPWGRKLKIPVFWDMMPLYKRNGVGEAFSTQR